MTFDEAIAKLNNDPCTTWNPDIFIGYSEAELAVMSKAWHGAIYAAAIAISNSK